MSSPDSELPGTAVTAVPGLSQCTHCGVLTAPGPKCPKCDCHDTPTCRHTSTEGDHA